MPDHYTGKCLCGAVTYIATGKPVIVAQCHCGACRRLSGTGHTVGAMFPSDAVEVVGALRSFRYVSDTGSEVTRAFCGQCGSPVYGSNTRLPDYVTLTLGTMENAEDLDVEVVVFDRDKPHWDQLGGDVLSFETQPDWVPND